MSTTPFLTAGRICLTTIAIGQCTLTFIADFNETHVRNPRWPPHARFHNGQTMSLSLTLGLFVGYLTWRPVLFPSRNYDVVDSTFLASVAGTLYWLCGLSAILYPGTKWVDPEFAKGGDLNDSPQRNVFTGHIVLAWVGYWLVKTGVERASKLKV